MCPDIEARDHGGDGAAFKFQRAGDMGIDLDRQDLSHQRFAGGDTFIEGLGCRTGYPRDRPHQIYQGRQVIGTHVEERSAALEEIKARIGMPAFWSMAEEEGGRRDGQPDRAIINDFARALSTAAQEGIGRATHVYALFRRSLDDRSAVSAVERQRFFAVSMLAGIDDLQRDFGMSDG